MGGGLFGTSFYLNPKCLLFSGFIVGVYFLPHPRAWQHTTVMIILLAMSGYIALAWYDYLFECRYQLQPTFLGYITGPFKPDSYSREFEQLPEENRKIIRVVDVLVLGVIFITAAYPFFIR